jgi:hypothetical protein
MLECYRAASRLALRVPLVLEVVNSVVAMNAKIALEFLKMVI